MASDWQLPEVERVFAQAAFGTTSWNDAMETVAEVARGIGAIMHPVTGKQSTLPFSRSLAGQAESYLRDGWVHRDVRFQCLPALLRNGVCSEDDYITPAAMDRHPYYQDFLARFGLRWFAALKVAAGEECWALSLQRTAAQGPFLRPELTKLAFLSAKLGSAAAIASALGFAKAEGASLAFQNSGLPAFLLDRQGQVILTNPLAERLLGPDIKLVQHRIRSFDAGASAALDRSLFDIMWRPERGACSLPIALPRASGIPLYAYAMVIDGINREVFAPCRAIVAIVDPAIRPRPTEEALVNAFQLTPAEARLAARMAQGTSLETVANELHIARETARNHLKAVFGKLNVSRQAELVALLTRFMIDQRL